LRETDVLELDIQPVTPARWDDLETLFGARGACGGCWCMVWRLPRREFERGKGAGNRAALAQLVASGAEPGLLAYHAGPPIGWCAVAPRDAYPALDRSRLFKPVDDTPVWSISCLFVARPFRRRGVTVLLLRAAVAHAGQQGARVVEGYPVEPRSPEAPPVFAWTGIASAFTAAGFVEVARRSETRPIMRRSVPTTL
jgi:GNAT superfamily N-acetyltransferase